MDDLNDPVVINDPSATLCVRRRNQKDYVRSYVCFIPAFAPLWFGGAAPVRPIMDPECWQNQYYSAVHRFGAALPLADEAEQRKFYNFAMLFIRSLPKMEIVDADVNDWVTHGNRTYEYQMRCVVERDETEFLSGDDFVTTSFGKHEHTPKSKTLRTISSYAQKLKAMLGPLFLKIDDHVFSSNKCFVKKIPTLERAAYIAAGLGGNPVNTTDYSSFECHHRGVYARVLYQWVMHVISNSDVRKAFRPVFKRMILGTNVCRYSRIEASVSETLMSGAVWTSSANGMLNLMLTSYMSLRTSYPHLNSRGLFRKYPEFVGFFEGDDGIFLGPPPTKELARALGTKLTIETWPDYTTASFCGINKPSLESDAIITDPVKVMVDMWTLHKKYATAKDSKLKGLVRHKAMSLLYQYPRCPVVAPMCYAICSHTRSYSMVWEDDYWSARLRKEMQEAGKFYMVDPLINDIDGQIRVAVENQFSLSLDWQRHFEEEIYKWARGEQSLLPTHPRLDPYFAFFSKHGSDNPVPAPFEHWTGLALPTRWTNVSTGLAAANPLKPLSLEVPLREHPSTALYRTY